MIVSDLQLLFKARNRRPKDHQDAAVMISTLSVEQRAFWTTHLGPDDLWLV